MVRLILLFLTAAIAGCSLLNTEQMHDSYVTEDGEIRLADTAKNWSSFTESVDNRVEAESAGEMPGAGKSTWDEYWNWSIELIWETPQDNVAKHVAYILDQRRQAGLPELSQK